VRNKTLHDFICCAIAAATTDEFSVKEFQTLKFTKINVLFISFWQLCFFVFPYFVHLLCLFTFFTEYATARQDGQDRNLTKIKNDKK